MESRFALGRLDIFTNTKDLFAAEGKKEDGHGDKAPIFVRCDKCENPRLVKLTISVYRRLLSGLERTPWQSNTKALLDHIQSSHLASRKDKSRLG